MRLVEGIRKHGYRRWYEAELGRSHIQLLLLIVSTIALFVAIELLTRRGPAADQILSGGLALLSGAIAARALRHYLFLLGRAEFVAGQAVCPGCSTYGRFRLDDGRPGGEGLTVRCRQCDAGWRIRDPDED